MWSAARIRKYASARAAALSGDNIPGEVYDNLVCSGQRIPACASTDMWQLRKKMLGR